VEPVIVKVKVPVCAVPVVITVSVEEPETLMPGGLKLPVAPDPKPPALKETIPLNPFEGVTDTV